MCRILCSFELWHRFSVEYNNEMTKTIQQLPICRVGHNEENKKKIEAEEAE